MPLFHLFLLAAVQALGGNIKWKCPACKVGVAVAGNLPLEALSGLIRDIAVPVCEYINGTGECDPNTEEGKFACEDLCKGIVRTEEPVLIEILSAKNYTNTGKCAAFGICPPMTTDNPPVPPAKIKSNLSDFSGENKWPNWPDNGGKLVGTFISFTDFHLQRDYQEGSETDCGQPICCRSEDGPGIEGQKAAHYGDHNCDTPRSVLLSMINQMQSITPKPDFIINTGDDPAHDVWNQTPELNSLAIQEVAEEIMGFISDRPYSHCFGNHESEPVNQYRGPGGDQYLYNHMADANSNWLSNDSQNTLRYGGFFQSRLAPKLRALVFHSTMWEGADWYFAANGTDFVGQFSWARDVLQQARERGEKVYVLHHHSQDDLNQYKGIFNKLLDDFSDIVIAEFAGHAHTTFHRVKRDLRTYTKPVRVEFFAGSGTPADNLNPTFRVYKYDTQTFEILDWTQHYLDIDQANANHTAGLPVVWYTDPPATEMYGISDVSAKSLDRLAQSWLVGPNASDTSRTWRAYANQMSRHCKEHAPINRIQEACGIFAYEDVRAHIPGCETSQADRQSDHDHQRATCRALYPVNSGPLPAEVMSRLLTELFTAAVEKDLVEL